MKKFLLNTSLYSIGLSLLVFLIGNIPISSTYVIFKTVQTDYIKIAWNLNYIDRFPEKIRDRIVFLGPSLTQEGICDSTLQAHGIQAINFGTNQAGNEIELYFYKRILCYHPKKVFLHLSKDKVKNLHSMTPLLYTPVELLSIGQSYFNLSFVHFIFKRTGFVLDYLVWQLYSRPDMKKNYKEFGVMYAQSLSEKEYKKISKAEFKMVFEATNLPGQDYKFSTEKYQSGLIFEIKRLRRRILYAFYNSEFIYNIDSQQKFVQEAFKMGKTHKIPTFEFYMPAIMDTKVGMNFNQSFFVPRDTVKVSALANYTFLDSSIYWSDGYHLSKQGAISFSQALAHDGVLERP